MNPSNPVFGSRGDFTTSPEISQIFGELVGIWLMSQWMSAGRPPAIRLIELGPGRGTLMDDILRVVAKFSNKIEDIHLVETSPAMRNLQKEKLHLVAKAGCQLHWHDSINDITPSNHFSLVVAHEFFDALPVHVLQKTQNGWNEVLVASNLEPFTSDRSSPETGVFSYSSPIYPRLRRVLSSTPTAASTVLGLSSTRFQNLPIGATIEVSPASFKIARQVGELLSCTKDQNQEQNTKSSLGGCGLIVDYGGQKVFGDSFRAFKDHKIVDVFHRPGECDLTTNVDFAFLREAMEDLVTTHGPIPQSTFLERMGLRLRVDALVRNSKTDERRPAIWDAAKRLVDPTGMGKEYQVMGITNFGSDSEALAFGEVWPFVEVKEEKDTSGAPNGI